MEFLNEYLTQENIELLCWALGALLAFEQLIAKSRAKSNSTIELILNVLKSLKGKNVAPMLLIMALVLPTITGCATYQSSPDKPGHLLAALQSDYKIALEATIEAAERGLLSDGKIERLDALVDEIEVVRAKAVAAFKAGQTIEANEWVRFAIPLLNQMIMEVQL